MKTQMLTKMYDISYGNHEINAHANKWFNTSNLVEHRDSKKINRDALCETKVNHAAQWVYVLRCQNVCRNKKEIRFSLTILFQLQY